MASSVFHLPPINFFTNGNPYSGSYNGMNYLVIPMTEKDETEEPAHLLLKVWYGMLCSDLSEMAATIKLSLDTDGLAQTVIWLEEQLALYAEQDQ